MDLKENLEVLADFGLFNEGAVEKLASLIRTVQSLAGSAPSAATDGGRGKRGPGRPPRAAETAAGPAGDGRGRAKRGSFNPTKEELAKLRETLTAKEIGEKFGVSPGTVAQRAIKLNLTTPRGKRGGK